MPQVHGIAPHNVRWWSCQLYRAQRRPSDALQVGDMGSGDLMVLAGTSKGSVSRLRLAAPLAPGSDPSEVQVLCNITQGFRHASQWPYDT